MAESTIQLPLAGRVALVTGAAGGIGSFHARVLAAKGATVALAGSAPSERLDALAQEVNGFALVGDVADPVAALRIAAAVEERFGRIDFLIANHAYMSMAPLEKAAPEDWWRVLNVNLGGTFRLIQAVLPAMRRFEFGRIVVVTSEWGVTGYPGATAYSASKAGLISLVKSLGRELAPEGILVNAIAPGVVDTPQLQVDADNLNISLGEMRERYSSEIPLGRLGKSEEIADITALLCDPRLQSMVGQTIQVNGGTTRGRV